MANTIVNLGSLRVGWAGAYNNTTTYPKNQIVFYKGKSYVSLEDNLTGIDPSDATKWELIVSGVPQDGQVGDVIVVGPSGPTLLSPSGGGQVLLSQGAGVIPEFGYTEYSNASKVKQLNSNRVCGLANANIVVMRDNTLRGWGLNGNYSLGLGDNTIKQSPFFIAIDHDSPIKKVIASGSSAFALFEDGVVYSWGLNTTGELGHGDTTSVRRPKKIAAFNGINIVDIKYRTEKSSTTSHVLYLTDDGKVYASGHNNRGQIGNGTTTDAPTPVLCQIPNTETVTAIDIICGGSHSSSFAVTSDGKLYAWGSNNLGQIGQGAATDVTTPTLCLVPTVKKIITLCGEVTSGVASIMVLTQSNEIYVTGSNGNGNLGLGDAVDRTSFTQVTTMGNDNDDIFGFGDAYYGYYMISKTDGRIYTCGSNVSGQLGIGSTSAVNIFTLCTINHSDHGGIKKIAGYSFEDAAGAKSSCAILFNNGKVYAAGENLNGVLPNADSLVNLTSFTPLSFGHKIIDIGYCGNTHTQYGFSIVDEFYDYYQSGFSNANYLMPNVSVSENSSFVKVSF